MNFLLSLLNLRPGRVGGAETYVRELLRHLPRHAGGDTLVAVMDRDLARTLPTEGFTRVVVNRSGGEVVAERILEAFTPFRAGAIEESFTTTRADAALFPQQSIFPKRVSIPSVLTAVDVQHLHCPEHFSRFDRAFRRRIYSESLARADRIISISGCTRRALVEKAAVPAEKIVVVPFGCWPPDVPGAAGLPGLTPPYFFYPAATYPHKNHERLLRTYAELRRRGEVAARLVFSGQKTAHWKRIESLIRTLGLERDVTHLGFVPSETVQRVYRGADAVLFPTLYEGYGLPVLEGVGSGKRVITSRLEVFDEVGVPRRNQIDFGDPDQLLAALRLEEPTVLEKRPWTWAEMAAATLDVLRDVAQRATR
ncbi:MAG TPA: glycosyltransferase family 1 protein [Thermoanaerobaculia bacterium]|nr:glycosyltransferase family 1 protein [Thermoanaerobaculia bacterium]